MGASGCGEAFGGRSGRASWRFGDALYIGPGEWVRTAEMGKKGAWRGFKQGSRVQAHLYDCTLRPSITTEGTRSRCCEHPDCLPPQMRRVITGRRLRQACLRSVLKVAPPYSSVSYNAPSSTSCKHRLSRSSRAIWLAVRDEDKGRPQPATWREKLLRAEVR